MDFKKSVSEYEKLHNTICEHNKESKRLRDQTETIGNTLKQYMESHNIDICNLANGDLLSLKTQVQLCPINKEYIHETLNDFFKKPHSEDPIVLADKTTDALLNNREPKDKTVLKIQKKK